MNYVWTLKDAGVIDQALVSFSIAGPNMDDQSYAVFGGLNPSQIVGGTEGLKKMQTMAYRPEWTQSAKQWALEGKTLMYGDEEWQKSLDKKTYPAIIDTGSSNLGVPNNVFLFLRDKWQKDLKDTDCITDDNFCQVMKPCEEAAKSLKPVSLQIGDQMFEMGPELYLH